MSPPPKCLYETLQVSLTATDIEIKKAYRAAALQSHPDKNPDNPESEELFKEIQHAYTVLSDPHERAWYDSHRAEILRGRQPGESDASGVSDIDLFAYFSSSVYKGFDGPEGFYEVFGGLFDRLWREEPDRGASPSFGSAKAEWGTVRQFYQEWEAFSSVRSFGMADKWNLAEAPNRDVRRAMEKENKRERTRVKKEFNSTIRELVSFVKKRDPRVVKRRKEEEEQRSRQERMREQRQAERRLERAKENERLREQRDQVLEEDAEGLDEILAGIALDEKIERRRRKNGTREAGSDDNQEDDADDDSELDDEEDTDDLYCVACKKPFRSAAQKTDHERSKKHRTAVAKLRKQLLAEDKALGNDDIELQGAQSEEETPVRQSKSKKKRKKKGKQPLQPLYNRDDEDEDDGWDADQNENGGERKSCDGTADSMPEDVVQEDETEAQDGYAEGPKEAKLSKREKRKLREAKRKEVGNVISYRCNTCGNPFPTRNKLMRHVESSGHAWAR